MTNHFISEALLNKLKGVIYDHNFCHLDEKSWEYTFVRQILPLLEEIYDEGYNDGAADK